MRNRTNKNTETRSQINARREARENGRGANSAYTGGARTAEGFTDNKGYRVSDVEGMKNAWNNGTNVNTYTKSSTGKMSVNGRTAGGRTWTFSDKENGRQSGRSSMASRRQRYYDVRKGLGLVGG